MSLTTTAPQKISIVKDFVFVRTWDDRRVWPVISRMGNKFTCEMNDRRTLPMHLRNVKLYLLLNNVIETYFI